MARAAVPLRFADAGFEGSFSDSAILLARDNRNCPGPTLPKFSHWNQASHIKGCYWPRVKLKNIVSAYVSHLWRRNQTFACRHYQTIAPAKNRLDSPTPGIVSPRATLRMPSGPSKTAVPLVTSRNIQPSMVVGLVSGVGVSLTGVCSSGSELSTPSRAGAPQTIVAWLLARCRQRQQPTFSFTP